MTTTAPSYCVRCGYRIDAGLQFCPQCGEPARQGVPSAPLPPQTPYGWMDDGGGSSRPADSPDPRRTAQPTHAQPQRQRQTPPQPAQQWMHPSAQPYAPPAPQPQPPYQPQYIQPYQPATQHIVHHHQVVQQPGGAPSAAMGIGITALCFMIMGLIPCLGWLNYFTIFLGVFSGVFSLISLFFPKFAGARGKLVIGLIFGFVAFFIGLIRLVIGGGCI